MTNPSETPGSKPADDLRIHRDDLEEVVAIAARLQVEDKENDDTFEGDAINSIVDTVGLSREELAEAQQVLKARKERNKWLGLGLVGLVLVVGLATTPLWRDVVFPESPQKRALQVESLVARAKTAIGAKDYASTVRLASEAVKKDPKNFHAWNLLGRGLGEQKRLVEASEAYQKGAAVAGIQPEAVELYCNYGTLLTKTPATRDDGVAAFKQALACNPDHARTHNNLAWLYELMNRKPEALQHYKRATELEPSAALYKKNYAEGVKLWGLDGKSGKP